MSVGSIEEFQFDFARAVRDPKAELSPGLGIATGDAWRFSIYRNNYYHGLIETLTEAYPSVATYLSEESFRKIALSYLQRSVVTEVSLALIAKDFPDFLGRANLADLAGLLSDLARLDRAYLEALHAPDQSTLNPTKLQNFGERIADAQFNFHSATRILSANRPLVKIWREVLGYLDPQDGKKDGKEDGKKNGKKDGKQTEEQQEGSVLQDAGGAIYGALITRLAHQVSVRPMTAAATQFGLVLTEGATVTQAFEKATAVDPAFDLTQAFSIYLEAGAIHDLQIAD